MAAYTHAFQTLLLELPNITEEDKLFAYSCGLKKEIAAMVQISNPATMDAAAVTADNIDAVYWER